jgi:hypothetical protein
MQPPARKAPNAAAMFYFAADMAYRTKSSTLRG